MALSFGSHVSQQAKEILEEATRIVSESNALVTPDPTLVAGLAQAMATLIAATTIGRK